MAEQASFTLAEQVGRREAQDRVARGEGLADALDPTSYLGSSDAFVERALDAYRSELG